MSDARQLAKACGAAQRAYQPVADMARITSVLSLHIARQGNVVLEELDLLRFYLREATLCSVIEPPEAASAAGTPGAPARARKPRSASKPPTKAKRKGKRR